MCMYVDNMINRNRNILVIILEMIIITRMKECA